jgi:glutaredoxin
MKLRKIPLDSLLEIIIDLYESGVDYIDIDGEQNKEGEPLKDSILITVKPEYIVDVEEYRELPSIFVDDNRNLCDEDINDLI